jgi:hypothetical protein
MTLKSLLLLDGVYAGTVDWNDYKGNLERGAPFNQSPTARKKLT